MRIRVGTSGFSYKEWKGTFYPAKSKDEGMLAYYAERLETVEINNTFYRMPKPELLQKWAADTPEHFAFVLKAPQKITHIKKLEDCASEVEYFLKSAESLGHKRGPILFQLPPWMKKDLGKLDRFLALLPEGTRAAFEFRHATWFDDETYALLKVVTRPSPPPRPTRSRENWDRPFCPPPTGATSVCVAPTTRKPT